MENDSVFGIVPDMLADLRLERSMATQVTSEALIDAILNPRIIKIEKKAEKVNMVREYKHYRMV